jgi:hypothetical protein
MTLLRKLESLVRVSAVREAEIQAALSSGFKDFEDAIQHFTAKAEGSILAMITRNESDYSPRELPVMSADEFLAIHPSKRKSN